MVYHREGLEQNGVFISGLIDKYSNVSRIHLNSNRKIRVDLLTDKDHMLMIVQNKENEKVSIEVEADFNGVKTFVEQFDDSKLEVTSKEACNKVTLSLEPNEVKVYREFTH